MPSQNESTFRADGFGKAGVVRDTPSVILPPSTFSNARNVRFHDGVVSKITGAEQVFPPLADQNGTLLTDVEFLRYWPNPNIPFWLYATDQNVYITDANGNVQYINQGGVAYSQAGRWGQSLFVGGYALILNNTLDTPQFLNDSQGDGTSLQLADLPGWNYSVGNLSNVVRAGVISSFGNVLIAGDLTITSTDSDTSTVTTTRLPGTVRISSRAAAGAIPQSWTPGELGDTSTADEFELSDTSRVITMAPLQGDVLVYTQDSIHRVGVSSATSTQRQVADGWGALTRNGVLEYDGKHLVVGINDVYLFAGHPGDIQSVIDSKMREYFYTNLNAQFIDNLFITRNISEDEIWIHFPTVASLDGFCDEALIWNYRENTWSISDGLGARSGDLGPVPGEGVVTSTFSFAGTPGETGVSNTGRTEVQTIAIDSGAVAMTADTDGEAQVEDIAYTGTRSNLVTTGTDEQVTIALDNRFDAGTSNPSSYSFTLDTTGEVFGPVVDLPLIQNPLTYNTRDTGSSFSGGDWDLKDGDQTTSNSVSYSTWDDWSNNFVVISDISSSTPFSGFILDSIRDDVERITISFSDSIEATFEVTNVERDGSPYIFSLGDVVTQTGTPETTGEAAFQFLQRGPEPITGTFAADSNASTALTALATAVTSRYPTVTASSVSAVDYFAGTASYNTRDTVGLVSGDRWDIQDSNLGSADSVSYSSWNDMLGNWFVSGDRNFLVGFSGELTLTIGAASATFNTGTGQATVGTSNEVSIELISIVTQSGTPPTTGSLDITGTTDGMAITLDTNQTTNINQLLTITANDGVFTVPELTATIDGVPPATGALSSYQVTGPGFSMAFTSSVRSTSDSDLPDLLSSIENAVDSNTELPIDFLVEQLTTPNRLRFTAQAIGVPTSSWSITADHGGGDGDIDFGTTSVVTTGTTPSTGPTVQLTAPDGTVSSMELFNTATAVASRTSAQIASEISSRFSFTGWTASASGSSVVFTADTANADIFGEFSVVVSNVGTSGTDTANFNDADFTTSVVQGVPIMPTEPTMLTFTFVGGPDEMFTFDGITLAQATQQVFDRLNANDRIDASLDNGVISVSPSQVGAASLILSDIIITQQGSTIPSPVTFDSAPVPSTFNLATDNISTASAANEGRPWPTSLLNEARQFVVVTNGSQILARDLTYQFDGVNYTSFVERQNITKGVIDDTYNFEHLYPLMEGTATEITINVRGKTTSVTSDIAGDSRTVTTTFNPQEDYKVDPRSRGRFFDVRFSDNSNQPWRLAGWYGIISSGGNR